MVELTVTIKSEQSDKIWEKIYNTFSQAGLDAIGDDILVSFVDESKEEALDFLKDEIGDIEHELVDVIVKYI